MLIAVILAVLLVIVVVNIRMESICINDSQKIYHDGGFSMACPNGWTCDKLIKLPNSGLNNAMYFRSNTRHAQIISVEQSAVYPSLRADRFKTSDKWTKENVIFQHHNATRCRLFSPGIVFDSPSQCAIYFIFECHGYWYKIGYRNYGFGNHIPTAAMDFLESVEINGCACQKDLNSMVVQNHCDVPESVECIPKNGSD